MQWHKTAEQHSLQSDLLPQQQAPQRQGNLCSAAGNDLSTAVFELFWRI